MADTGYLTEFVRMLQGEKPDDLLRWQFMFLLRQCIYSESLAPDEAAKLITDSLEALPEALLKEANNFFEEPDSK